MNRNHNHPNQKQAWVLSLVEKLDEDSLSHVLVNAMVLLTVLKMENLLALKTVLSCQPLLEMMMAIA